MTPETLPGRLGWLATLRLAWRNLRRNKRRTWITAVTVSLAVLLLQLSIAVMIGVERQSYDNLINYQTAHAKLYAAGYFENREELPLDYTLTDLEALQASVQQVSGVAATTPRLAFQASLSDGVDQVACFGTGIQLAGSDTEVFRIPQAIVAGEYLRPGEEGMLLGSGLAELFDAEVGDWLTVLTKTRDGAYEALDLPIVGIVGTGNPVIDRNTFLVSLETARYMLDLQEEATEVAVRFSLGAREMATLRALVERVEQLGYEVKGWREAEADFLAFAAMKRLGSVAMLSIFVVLALVGVTNTVLMAAFERTREVGMLMAMGLRGGGVRKLFLTEGALAGLLGGAVGSLLALVLIAYLASVGINITALYGEMDIGYPVKDRMYAALEPLTLVVVWLATGLAAAAASLYPAARASRRPPVEALRHA
ncbi:MAG: ABC transporter permease [Gemmatimonadota bacterium]|nr:MAG: ABC transporter permease [Gemmatimonadota bacterium]